MAEYSNHQRKIIKRHYDNANKVGYQRLSELVSDLYLAEGKKADTLWQRVDAALGKVGIPDSRRQHVMRQRDLKTLAALVAELTG